MVRAARPLLGVVLGLGGLLAPPVAEALNVERLEPAEEALLHATLQRLEPLITAKKHDGTVNLLTWEALVAPLTNDERAFVEAFRALKAEALGSTSHYFGQSGEAVELVPVGLQQVTKNTVPSALDPQYLPPQVMEAYQRMMEAMERDLGRRLLVESGYRAPAYQLYLFLLYLPKHAYSIRETNRHVALPGYSEHGNPKRQAIDFVNQEGINGEDRPEDFEALPEYQWLVDRARRFGFYLSYPRDNPHHTAFEPWHWHYENSSQHSLPAHRNRRQAGATSSQ